MKTRFSTKIKMAAAACCTSVALIGACPMTTLAYSGHDFNRIGKLSGYSKQGYRYKVGDCNGDGNVNRTDASILYSYVLSR